MQDPNTEGLLSHSAIAPASSIFFSRVYGKLYKLHVERASSHIRLL